MANGGNIAINDHTGIVNGSYSFLKHFDITLNVKKCIIVMMQIARLISKTYLIEVHLTPKKQQVMSFSILIHQDQRKSGNLKLVAEIS